MPPKLGANLDTEKFEIHLEPEVDYKNIQVHISHDRLLQAIEDKPEVHLTDKGLSVQMTSKEKMWCTKCYFYLIVTMEEDRRLYATAEASSLGQLGKGIVQDIDNYYIANEGRWECDIYTVTSAKNDVMITISNWQGLADFYIAARMDPKDSRSSSIKFATRKTHDKQVILASADDRLWWTARLGDYYICSQTHDTLSANIVVKEEKAMKGRYESALFNYLYHLTVHQDRPQQFVFSDERLFTSRAFIRLRASVYMSEYSDKNDLVFFYKLCKFEIGDGDKCFFTDDDLSDVSTLPPLEVTKTKDVDSSSGSKLTSYEYSASFYHEKDDCQGGTVCKFVVAIKNP